MTAPRSSSRNLLPSIRKNKLVWKNRKAGLASHLLKFQVNQFLGVASAGSSGKVNSLHFHQNPFRGETIAVQDAVDPNAVVDIQVTTHYRAATKGCRGDLFADA